MHCNHYDLDTIVYSWYVFYIRNIFIDSACVQLEVELEADPSVSQEHIDQALELGVDFGAGRVDAQKYTVAFFQKLLHLREKLEKGFLNIPSKIADVWKKFLRTVEEEGRKLLDISSGSVNFTLFCPTNDSALQTQNESWRQRTLDNMNDLLITIGM